MCEKVYGSRLECFEDILVPYDWHAFVAGYRPKKADRGIQSQFSMTFEVRDHHHVFVRSKSAVGAKTPWSSWCQCYPSLLTNDEHTPHLPTTVPPVAELKDWPDFDTKVVSTLRK